MRRHRPSDRPWSPYQPCPHRAGARLSLTASTGTVRGRRPSRVDQGAHTVPGIVRGAQAGVEPATGAWVTTQVGSAGGDHSYPHLCTDGANVTLAPAGGQFETGNRGTRAALIPVSIGMSAEPHLPRCPLWLGLTSEHSSGHDPQFAEAEPGGRAAPERALSPTGPQGGDYADRLRWRGSFMSTHLHSRMWRPAGGLRDRHGSEFRDG